MGSVLIYLVDCLWVGVLVFSIARHRLRFAVMPLSWVAVAHLIFFASPPVVAPAMVGLVHLMASLAILAGYGVVMAGRTLPPPKQARRPLTYIHVDNYAVQTSFLIFCLLLVLVTKLLALMQGASLVDVLFGMRVGYRARVSPLIALIITFTSRAPVVGLALGRLWLETVSRKGIRILWWTLAIAFLTTGFATGGRTALAFPLLVILVVDIYALAVLKIRQSEVKKAARVVFYSLLGMVVFLGMSYQTLFRGRAPESFDEAFRRFQQVLSSEVGGNEGRTLGKELGSGLNDSVGFVVVKYGNEIPFAYGFSVYAMAVNPIPRVLWQSKPPGWGQRLAFEVLGKTPGDAFGTSMAAGISGEAYANGGFAGVLLFGFLFGLLFGLIAKKLLFPGSLLEAAIWLAALTWMFGLYRGDWLSNVNRGIYCLLSAALGYWFLRVFFGRGAYYVIADVDGFPANQDALSGGRRLGEAND